MQEGEEETQGGASANEEEEAIATRPPGSDETRSSFSSNATRTHSALHNRLLNQQRSNILLQVLFQHMLNSRRRREEETALALTPPPLPDREMPVLSHEEALAVNAMCRFCFEGSLAKAEDEEKEGSATSTNTHDRSEDSNNDNNGTTNSLVAPCNCDGGSRWVHLECLRQWQRMQARSLSNPDNNLPGGESTTYTAAGYICNVCNSPYLSRPPAIRSVRRNLLKRGTLLVSKPNVGRTFQQTVVLLLSDVCGNPQGTFGLIVNSPLQAELPPISNLLAQNSTTTTTTTTTTSEDSNENASDPTGHLPSNTTSNPVIEWRRGGPVCGGRLGVVHYTVLHTYPPSLNSATSMDMDVDMDDVLDVDIDEEYFEENDEHEDGDNETLPDTDDIDLEAPLTDHGDDVEGEDGSDQDEEDDDVDNDDDDLNMLENDSCAPLSLPVFEVTQNAPPLQFVASPYSSIPSTFSEDSLGHTVQRLVQNNNSEETEQQVEVNEESNSTEPGPSRVIVFSGYCKWRAGQLEREIQREVWDVCVDATPADILRHHGSRFWEEISESNRLLSWQGLIEEGES